MKIIDMENHFSTPLWVDIMKTNKGFPRFDKDRGLGYAENTWIPITGTGG